MRIKSLRIILQILLCICPPQAPLVLRNKEDGVCCVQIQNHIYGIKFGDGDVGSTIVPRPQSLSLKDLCQVEEVQVQRLVSPACPESDSLSNINKKRPRDVLFCTQVC